MIDTALPIHLVTGVRAIGWRKARRGEAGPQPIWPICGGSGEAEDDTGDGESKDAGDDSDAADDQGDDTDTADSEGEDKPLGPAGEKALRAMKERLAAAEEMLTAAGITSKTQARRIARDRAKAKETKAAPKPVDNDKPVDDDADKPDPEKIRAEVRAELEAAALKERVLDKIEVKAAKGFADPTDAVAVLMRDHEIDDFLDGGKLDVEAIQDALDELLKKKPYLAAAAQGGSKRFQGSAEGGAKPQKPARPKSLDEAVQRHFAS